MAKNRYMLCFLVAIFLIYYGGPRLPLDFASTDGIFTLSWTILALLVVGGNLTGALKVKEAAGGGAVRIKEKRRRIHSRH
ncbi:hypothetical protein [Neobacillus sp. YIM B06451]|uniref:hypothetical protein n=1 Tax=Neobacillus sp. YIM B06451 TaxID=3070994 RepID=UPI00292CEE90|nr:hypothetical protein [Neobacillus sp. YIM B06451]